MRRKVVNKNDAVCCEFFPGKVASILIDAALGRDFNQSRFDSLG